MWNERYADAYASYGTAPNDFVRVVAPRLPEGPVLELAAGEGRNAVFLASRGHAVTAVDQSDVGLANAEALAKEAGVGITTVVADLADFDLGTARWSGIVATFAHLPPALRKRVHAACVQALRPGGVLILEAYAPDQLAMPGKGGPPRVELLFSAEAARVEFAGLTFELLQQTKRVVDEGRYHSGLSATTQLVATKS